MPSFSIFGVQPNLVLVLLVAWLIVRPRREGLLLVPAAGLMVGLLDGQPLGLAMLALAPLVLLAELRDMRLVESDLLPAVVIAGAGTLVYEGIVLLTLAVTGEQLDWLASVLDVLVPAAIANVLLVLPIYGLMRLASMDLRTRRPAF
jgi:rod shape-determining protein MreD